MAGKETWKLASDKVSPILTGGLNAFLSKYWARAPTAGLAMDFLENQQKGNLYFDHFAFRTFGMNGCGIDSLASTLQSFGYERRDNLIFKQKKLNAYWFAPPVPELPRIFISELQVEAFSDQVQEIIGKYTKQASPASDHMFLSGSLGVLPWKTPALEDFKALAEVSEYAAWTLVNGYSLNHTTISVHNLSRMNEIEDLVRGLEGADFKLNSSGGVVKTSPDGGLRQISTLADTFDFEFEGGKVVPVSGPYIEFAQRLVLPEFSHLPEDQIEEHHRRDGFEQGNADKIFESTQVGGS
ncbi:DUF1338 domain-containing protein [Chloropicon primus]|uniref:2-oxoadipate dioxygenase/decarboxylase n=2 Tax=Chloropicon primus TaxID=1764295 RepID=A0A5B8ME85_9CHLO|nr:DUF1338 domain-containing protein [Chloropicon primus]UPQ96828.1 DUF1338 domain-containing protein [Chloropicon primus]|eukprot:QDZ17612.1 DUF1338 domain-containing protein [Chloropicon primus]